MYTCSHRGNNAFHIPSYIYSSVQLIRSGGSESALILNQLIRSEYMYKSAEIFCFCRSSKLISAYCKQDANKYDFASIYYKSSMLTLLEIKSLWPWSGQLHRKESFHNAKNTHMRVVVHMQFVNWDPNLNRTIWNKTDQESAASIKIRWSIVHFYIDCLFNQKPFIERTKRLSIKRNFRIASIWFHLKCIFFRIASMLFSISPAPSKNAVSANMKHSRYFH